MSFDTTRIGWISGMPRSGTTWLSQIFASSPDVRLKFCRCFPTSSSTRSTPAAVRMLGRSSFGRSMARRRRIWIRIICGKMGTCQKFPSEKSAPDHLIIKSNRFHHLVPGLLQKVADVKVIHLVRHPAATLHSWLTDQPSFQLGPNHFPSGGVARAEKQMLASTGASMIGRW